MKITKKKIKRLLFFYKYLEYNLFIMYMFWVLVPGLLINGFTLTTLWYNFQVGFFTFPLYYWFVRWRWIPKEKQNRWIKEMEEELENYDNNEEISS